jgi:hypothetical protein
MRIRELREEFAEWWRGSEGDLPPVRRLREGLALALVMTVEIIKGGCIWVYSLLVMVWLLVHLCFWAGFSACRRAVKCLVFCLVSFWALLRRLSAVFFFFRRKK